MTATATVVHTGSGRLRIRVAGPSGEVREVLQSVARSTAEGPVRAHVSPRTRTVLVEWDTDQVDTGQVVDTLRPAHPALRDLTISVLEQGNGQHAARPSTVARTIEQRLGTANRRVGNATENVVDLRMLVPIGLAALSVRQLLRQGPRLVDAPWYLLAYYAFDTYIKLHHTPPTDLRPLAEIENLATD